MQQIITFRIEVTQDFLSIKDNIRAIIQSYDFEAFPDDAATEKRIKTWFDNILFTPGQGDTGTIINMSESTMYEFDYSVLFPYLFFDIADACPAAQFSGHSEYYNDDYGVMEEHDFSYPQNNNEEETTVSEAFNKDELIQIIRKILVPLSTDEIAKVCEYIDVDTGNEDIPVAIYNEAVEYYDESLDGIMQYIYNNLIEAVINVAGIIIYDPEWNGSRN